MLMRDKIKSLTIFSSSSSIDPPPKKLKETFIFHSAIDKTKSRSPYYKLQII